MFGTLSFDVIVLTVLYSIAGLGIAIVNDFKSIEGDRQMGLQSLPVAFVIEKAKFICAASIDVTQLSVALYLWQGLNKPIYAAVLLGLILPQVWLLLTLFDVYPPALLFSSICCNHFHPVTCFPFRLFCLTGFPSCTFRLQAGLLSCVITQLLRPNIGQGIFCHTCPEARKHCSAETFTAA